MPVQDWHTLLPDPTIADAALDRLLHNSHRIDLRGESLRKIRGQAEQTKSGAALTAADMLRVLAASAHLRSYARRQAPLFSMAVTIADGIPGFTALTFAPSQQILNLLFQDTLNERLSSLANKRF